MVERVQSKLPSRWVTIPAVLVLLAILMFLSISLASSRRQNASLRERLTALEDLEGENAELRGRLDRAPQQDPSAQSPTTETLRLRGQVGALRQQLRDAERRGRPIGESTPPDDPEGRREADRLRRELRALQRATNSMPPRPPRTGAWLGVNISAATSRPGEPAGENPSPGVLIQSVTPGSPASRSQLLAGDLVVRLDGQEIIEVQQFKRILSERTVNQPLVLEVVRGDESLRVEVTPTDWPQ